MYGRQVGSLTLKCKIPSLFPGQDNLVSKDVITIVLRKNGRPSQSSFDNTLSVWSILAKTLLYREIISAMRLCIVTAWR